MHTARILESITFLRGSDPTGNISGGHVTMTGLMRRTKPRIRTGHDVHQQFEWYDTRHWFYPVDKTNNDIYHCLMSYSTHPEKAFGLPWHDARQQLKVGFILESLEGPGTEARIGMFAHPLPNIAAENGVVLLPGEYQEFLLCDLANCKCQTVKIISVPCKRCAPP